MVYVCCAGLTDGCYCVLLPLLTSHFLGADRAPTAWGFVVATCSISFMTGPALTGDDTIDYLRFFKTLFLKAHLHYMFFSLKCNPKRLGFVRNLLFIKFTIDNLQRQVDFTKIMLNPSPQDLCDHQTALTTWASNSVA